MKNIFLFILASFLLIACKKNGFNNFNNATWDKKSYNNMEGVLAGNTYGDGLIDKKVVRIQSLGELDSLGTVISSTISSDFSSFDFTKNNLFIVLFTYDGKDYEEVTKSKICINESTKSILFDFKAKVNVGGSGMNTWSSLYYFTIPIEKSNYDVSGTIKLNEKSSLFQNDDHDFTNSYSLFQ